MFRLLLPLILLLALPIAAHGQRKSEFCRGFEEGWKAIRGELALTPLCPVEPITPIGSTPFREGLKAGMARARQ